MSDDEHLKFYRSEDLQDEIIGTLSFEPVKAGEKVERKIYVENVIDYEIKVDGVVLKEDTGSVELKSSFESIQSGEVETVELVFDTDLERLKPLEVDFGLDYHFLVD